MQVHNLLWMEVEAQHRVAELTASRGPRRPRRKPVFRFPASIVGRLILGHGLIALGERLAEPGPIRQRSAA